MKGLSISQVLFFILLGTMSKNGNWFVMVGVVMMMVSQRIKVWRIRVYLLGQLPTILFFCRWGLKGWKLSLGY